MKFMLLCMLFLSGCATPLFITDSGVSIYLVEEPEVQADSYKIEFQFETPTEDPQIIQQIELGPYNGIESFDIKQNNKTGIDVHHQDGDWSQKRRMTLMPGEVRGADKRNGFAMLPSDWPENFNLDYLKDHKIQGEIVKMRPEWSTVYHLDFENGKLVWCIEGTDIRQEWSVEAVAPIE